MLLQTHLQVQVLFLAPRRFHPPTFLYSYQVIFREIIFARCHCVVTKTNWLVGGRVTLIHGELAKLANAYGSNPYAERLIGSIPILPTIHNEEKMKYKKENILGHEEYQVDTNGVIYNKNGSVKSTSTNHKGYKIVTFCENGILSYSSVHKIVAKQFIPNPENKYTVDHINMNKSDNRVCNLRWSTSKEQREYFIKAVGIENLKCNRKQIIGIDKNTKEQLYIFDSLTSASKFFANGKNYKYYKNSIYRALKGIRKSYKGCIWKYL